MKDLPIHAVLPDLLAALREKESAVLIAPPGAGKTTSVATALLAEPWCEGTVILLSPRRVAARAAAERMAELLGEAPGQTVGYLTRLDSKRSAATRVLVVTEAIFVSTILGDPELAGVSAVLFDEAHERHLDSDLGLALAIESQQVLRPDLRIVVMSATIDGTRFASLLDQAPVIESAGKAFPLAIRWLGARPELRIEDAMTSAVLTAWREETGDVLAFLPGVGEIERTRERLEAKLPGELILPLHGQCEPAAQRAAIKRDPGGRRRIVLATAIAETSLTLDGVSVVVDAGLSRRAEFDKAAGVTRLVTHRASQAAAAQRAGRAARQGPGVAYRLWEEAAHAGRPAFDPPEMLTSDLAPLLLSLAQWGAGDPAALPWLDPPPAASVGAARSKLLSLQAIDGEGRITDHGKAMAALPMEPPLAHMLLFAAEHGAAQEAARLALLLQERGLGGRSEDLALRLDRWNGDRSGRAEASRKLAAGWAKRVRDRGEDDGIPLGVLLAEGFPDNLAKRRDAKGEDWLTAGGRGLRLDPASSLARAEWLAVGEAQGSAGGARITGAVALTEAEVLRWLGHRIEKRSTLRWVADGNRVEAMLEQRLGTITVSRGPDSAPDKEAIVAFLLERVRAEGLDLVPFSAGSRALLTRARHSGIEALSEAALLEELEDWLAPLLGRRLDALDGGKLHEALRNRMTYDDRQKLEKLAPAEFRSPAGSTHAIDYADEGGPSVEVRVQALFGLDRHPGFGQPSQPLLLKLTSPGGKPIQVTRDLPGFWRGSWRDVVRDMKGRYPKHRWPEEPWAEDPSLKTKNAFEASRRS
ncbi:ATP-dependent helicase HrpB [Novosphingobium sp. JCM 18896]|uniref:ATP-dependent helicase HrpB n=1 Tax=Novosphingobium sp. JCM 18896 TaxID=2989731 RepID=UPI0022225015|nr:ATP-dependent helicase HrpB [Novosphingobium sp. JCM 18896]MCW1428064.1 ATP-dependent helicase HrpB [Novosphingobium sp. JCM 18896]